VIETGRRTPTLGNALGDAPHDVWRLGARSPPGRGDLRQLRPSTNHRRSIAPAAQPQDRGRAIPLRAVRLGRIADDRQAAPLARSACQSCAQAALNRYGSAGSFGLVMGDQTWNVPHDLDPRKTLIRLQRIDPPTIESPLERGSGRGFSAWPHVRHGRDIYVYRL
jgi:hypothetical protein